MKGLLGCCFVLECLLMLTAFNLDNAIVPKGKILSGGPPKDGIPAILNAKFITPEEADFLKPGDGVIGVQGGGEARAYPIKILNWHEVVNDTIDAVPIFVTELLPKPHFAH